MNLRNDGKYEVIVWMKDGQIPAAKFNVNGDVAVKLRKTYLADERGVFEFFAPSNTATILIDLNQVGTINITEIDESRIVKPDSKLKLPGVQ